MVAIQGSTTRTAPVAVVYDLALHMANNKLHGALKT